MPNDDDEQVRLQLLNQVYLKIFDGELTTVPLECPTHILDIGTAVGEWAIDMAETYPECEVTGTDISNIFERRVPQNVYWEIDDAELEWERPSNHYDLIHFRDMTGAFADWEAIYRSAFRCLKPGGWIEVLDFDDRKGLHDLFAYFEPESLLYKMAHDLQEASVMSGRPRGVGHLEPRLLVNAGYVDVKLTEYSIPLKTQDGSTGKFWLLSCLNGMEPVCMRLLTKFKGWSPDDVRLGCETVAEELMTLAHDPQRAKSFVVKLRVLTGRKPGHHVRWSTAPLGELGGAMELNEDRLPVDSASSRNPADIKGASAGARHPNNLTTEEEQRQSVMSAINNMAEKPSNIDGHPHSTGDATEDWLRNVDDLGNDIDYDEQTDAMTEDTMIDEGEEDEARATTSTGDSFTTPTKNKVSLENTSESPGLQYRRPIREHAASGTDGTIRASRPRMSTL
jgi:SAM-dependent methyltransferase